MLTNEAAVEQALRERGFQIVDIATMSAEQICRASLNARIVAGVEGSHLSHGIFSAADDATFLVLQPPDRFCMTYKEFTDAMADMRCAFLVGDPHPGGFTVPPDDLNRLLDLIQAR